MRHIAGAESACESEQTSGEKRLEKRSNGAIEAMSSKVRLSTPLSTLFSKIVRLPTGKFFLFAPTAILIMTQMSFSSP